MWIEQEKINSFSLFFVFFVFVGQKYQISKNSFFLNSQRFFDLQNFCFFFNNKKNSRFFFLNLAKLSEEIYCLKVFQSLCRRE